MSETRRTVLITGASAGIGEAFAHHAAARSYNVVLVARRLNRLDELAASLADAHGIDAHVFAVDLSEPGAPESIVDFTDDFGIPIDVLINNAGLSTSTPFTRTEWSDLSGQIQIMMTAPTELSHRLIPAMIERGWGRIINVSSLAALLPPTRGSLYTPIKRYLFDFSQSLHNEVHGRGVNVTALCPGLTHTEFHEVMGTQTEADKIPGFMWGNTSEVVNAGWNAVMAGNPICVPRAVDKAVAALMHPVPLRLHPRIVSMFDPFRD